LQAGVEHVVAAEAAEILVPENYFALPKSARQVAQLVAGLREEELVCRVLDQRSRQVLLLPCSQLQPRPHHVILHSSRKQRRQQQQQQAPCRHDLTLASSTQQLQQLHAFLQQHACVDEETRQLLHTVRKLVRRGVHGRRHHKLLHLQCDVMLAYENCKRRRSTTTTTPSPTTTTMAPTGHQSTELHQTPVTTRSRFDWDISNIDYDGELFEDPFLFY
jgi:hypothetical protein